ncbi:MAG: hypothetical protein ACXAC8_19015 [Candidatus Hodarchaeales archaeon]
MKTAVPVIVGWFGIDFSTIYGLGNGIQSVKPNLKVLRASTWTELGKRAENL